MPAPDYVDDLGQYFDGSLSPFALRRRRLSCNPDRADPGISVQRGRCCIRRCPAARRFRPPRGAGEGWAEATGSRWWRATERPRHRRAAAACTLA